MIAAFDNDAQVWLAAGNGVMRSIVVEGHNREEAVKAYAAAYGAQELEEEAFAREYEEGECLSALNAMADGSYAADGDMG